MTTGNLKFRRFAAVQAFSNILEGLNIAHYKGIRKTNFLLLRKRIRGVVMLSRPGQTPSLKNVGPFMSGRGVGLRDKGLMFSVGFRDKGLGFRVDKVWICV